jgi:hypothetical protein
MTVFNISNSKKLPDARNKIAAKCGVHGVKLYDYLMELLKTDDLKDDPKGFYECTFEGNRHLREDEHKDYEYFLNEHERNKKEVGRLELLELVGNLTVPCTSLFLVAAPRKFIEAPHEAVQRVYGKRYLADTSAIDLFVQEVDATEMGYAYSPEEFVLTRGKQKGESVESAILRLLAFATAKVTLSIVYRPDQGLYHMLLKAPNGRLALRRNENGDFTEWGEDGDVLVSKSESADYGELTQLFARHIEDSRVVDALEKAFAVNISNALADLQDGKGVKELTDLTRGLRYKPSHGGAVHGLFGFGEEGTYRQTQGAAAHPVDPLGQDDSLPLWQDENFLELYLKVFGPKEGRLKGNKEKVYSLVISDFDGYSVYEQFFSTEKEAMDFLRDQVLQLYLVKGRQVWNSPVGRTEDSDDAPVIMIPLNAEIDREQNPRHHGRRRR